MTASIWRRCPTSRSRSGRCATRAGVGAFIGRFGESLACRACLPCGGERSALRRRLCQPAWRPRAIQRPCLVPACAAVTGPVAATSLAARAWPGLAIGHDRCLPGPRASRSSDLACWSSVAGRRQRAGASSSDLRRLRPIAAWARRARARRRAPPAPRNRPACSGCVRPGELEAACRNWSAGRRRQARARWRSSARAGRGGRASRSRSGARACRAGPGRSAVSTSSSAARSDATRSETR